MNTGAYEITVGEDAENMASQFGESVGRIREWFAGFAVMCRAAAQMLRRQKNDWERAASLASRGARLQFGIAIALVSVIPLLALGWLCHDKPLSIDITNGTHLAVLGTSALMIVLGYMLLTKYPRTIVSLRYELEKLASGEIPDIVNFEEREQDIQVLEQCMNFVLKQTRERIKTIEEQSRKLAEAERMKVMVESLAAACHHLGQPAMTLTVGIELLQMQNRATDPLITETLAHCRQASAELSKVLKKLHNLREYRTEPYLTGLGGSAGDFTDRILVVN